MNDWNTPIQHQLTAWLSRRTTRNGVRRVVPLSAAIASELGMVRSENQDRAIIVQGWDGEGRRFAVGAVADGIGGMRDGGACAALTLGAFVAAIHHYARTTSVESDDLLSHAFFAANEAVHNQFKGDGGATLVAVILRQNSPTFWASVGDSRIYKTVDGTVRQLSVDDTIAGQLGKRDDENIEHSKLLQYIGMGSDLEPHVDETQHSPMGSLLLTTDGVHYLARNSILMDKVVLNSPDPGACVKRLVELANWCGGPDNATVLVMPLSVDFESAYEPPYSCLDVWDSYGDLQLIVGGVQKELSGSNRNDKSDNKKNSLSVQSKKLTSSSVSRSVSVVDRGKTASVKQTSKDKGGSVKRISRSRNKQEVPQLLMEFPHKTD
ncbi:PP2C family protein-serine/threonine phosphatase [Pseudomonas syringae]|uniref:PP2C family protein-serine/threonine phosphatase n=1 Tax=Pseudomonas syringae TaxID=317 RepID=UPI00035235F2|nr:PP2C family serine/threonine-protein phosphatase [Pseudomonas syringae]EPF68314.1 Prophage PssSM-03, putative protein phosphatase [Pseudomonas syringae pv. syringae SM]